MSENKVTVTFITAKGEKMPVTVDEGTTVLEAARQGNVPLEGSCEGSLACSTCHVIVEDKAYYDKMLGMSEDGNLSEEEEDLLDMAFAITPTSRLGCQIVLSKELDGLVLKIPSGNRNEI